MKDHDISPPNVIGLARDFTLKAMENNMITISSEPKETAQNVMDFYHTIVEHIND